MTDVPRILTIMGSGETAPTMVKTHRGVLDRLGPAPVPAVMLDTPFGFQANADIITERALDYFRSSVGHEMGVASYRDADHADPLAYETMLTRLREARYCFAGPGSPTYALRQWQGSLVPKILAEKLQSGGAVTFSSAAALTLGVATIPVYEIYKVGAEPAWMEGLDLLSTAGLSAAVIPHYNNAEGGNHDTRFCYLGEPRLALMERQLPPGAFVLGVDEHTALVLDIDAGTATVVGLGVVTVRAAGRSNELASGTVLPIAELHALAYGSSTATSSAGAVAAPAVVGGAAGTSPTLPTARSAVAVGAGSPLRQAITSHEEAFAAALLERDVEAAVATILALDDELAAWAGDTLQTDDADHGRAALRSMVVRLGELAQRGAKDPSAAVGPFVELLLGQRTSARADKRWADADAVRDGLTAAGVEVRDSPEGTSWLLLS